MKVVEIGRKVLAGDEMGSARPDRPRQGRLWSRFEVKLTKPGNGDCVTRTAIADCRSRNPYLRDPGAQDPCACRRGGTDRV